jgi:hypothetical protein
MSPQSHRKRRILAVKEGGLDERLELLTEMAGYGNALQGNVTVEVLFEKTDIPELCKAAPMLVSG